MERRKLTKSEIEALGPEYRRQFELALIQVEEQKVTLRTVIALDDRLSPAEMGGLLASVANLKLSLVTTDRHNITKALRVSVVHEYPDPLYDYLNQAEDALPKKLRGWLKDGHVLDFSQPAIEPV